MTEHSSSPAFFSGKSWCVVVSLLALLFILNTHLPVAQAAEAGKKPAPVTCSQQVALVKYRSDLLTVYKQSDHAKYKTFRQQWANRIVYASQWVPEDARKTRESLYKYDALHARNLKEIDAQIRAAAGLKKAALGCSGAQKAVLRQKLVDIKGVKDGRVVGGNALISQNKREETKFQNNEFKKSRETLIRKLHAAKVAHPTPQHKQKFEIKSQP